MPPASAAATAIFTPARTQSRRSLLMRWRSHAASAKVKRTYGHQSAAGRSFPLECALLELIPGRCPCSRQRGGAVVEKGPRPCAVARVGAVAQVTVEPIVPELSGAIHPAAAAPVVAAHLANGGVPAEGE